jgi:hypothetical protein
MIEYVAYIVPKWRGVQPFNRYLDGIVEKHVDATYLENILGE